MASKTKIKITKEIVFNSFICLEFTLIEQIANKINGKILIILLSTLLTKK